MKKFFNPGIVWSFLNILLTCQGFPILYGSFLCKHRDKQKYIH